MTKHRASTEEKMETAKLFEVKAEAGLANGELNGERVMLVHTAYVGVVEGIIVTGKHAGRRWRFRSKDIKEVGNA